MNPSIYTNLLRLCVFGFAILFAARHGLAQMPAQGAVTASVAIAGKTVTCTSGGQAVVWRADYQLQDVGLAEAGFGSIRYNPKVVASLTPGVALFWLGHECGHAYQQTGNEDDADCWSAKKGVNQGWFKANEFDTLSQQMQISPGDATHRPGPDRMKHIKECMDQAENNTKATKFGEMPPNPIVVPDTPDFDEEASKCPVEDSQHEVISWSTTSRNQMNFHLNYMNTCDQAVKCKMRFATGSIRGTGFHSFDETFKNLNMPIRGTGTVDGSLTWDTTDKLYRDFRFADTGETGAFKPYCKFTP